MDTYTDLMVSSNKKQCFVLRGPGGFIEGQHHPKSVFNLGPKVGPGLNPPLGLVPIVECSKVL